MKKIGKFGVRYNGIYKEGFGSREAAEYWAKYATKCFYSIYSY